MAFAILITEENLPKMAEVEGAPPNQLAYISRYYVDHRVDWYYVTGYVSRKGGPVHPWSIFPASVFVPNNDFDPEKIKTDWTIYTRKD